MNTVWKRSISLVLALLMLAALVPVSALAEDGEPSNEPQGTVEALTPEGENHTNDLQNTTTDQTKNGSESVTDPGYSSENDPSAQNPSGQSVKDFRSAAENPSADAPMESLVLATAEDVRIETEGDVSEEDARAAVAEALANEAVVGFDQIGIADATEDEVTGGYLRMELLRASTANVSWQNDDATVTSMEFAVTPYAVGENGEETLGNDELTGSLTFRMPVSANTEAETASLYHNGAFIGVFDVQNENGEKFIELSADSFSTYGYTLRAENTQRTIAVSSDPTIDLYGFTMPVAKTGGGGMYYDGEQATVIAYPSKGYVFVGWYRAEDTEFAQMLSNRQSYTFTVDGDASLIAKFEKTDDTAAKLTISASFFTLNDGVRQNSSASVFLNVGETVFVKFDDPDKEFLYWVNSTGNIMSTSENFAFVLTADMSIEAYYVAKAPSNTDSMVIFRNAYQQIITSLVYSVDQKIDFPSYLPNKMGSTFVNWYLADETGAITDVVATQDTIHEAMTKSNLVTVLPGYTQSETLYTTNIHYRNEAGEQLRESATETAVPGNKIDIKAPAIENYTFLYWKIDDVIVGYNDIYTVLRASECTVNLIAVYGTEKEDEQPLVLITQSYAKAEDSLYILSNTMQYYTPQSYEVVEVGFVYGTKNSLFGAEDGESKLVLEAPASVYKHVTGSTENRGQYTFNGKVTQPTTRLYIRAYVIYRDPNGVRSTMYTPMRVMSYNSLVHADSGAGSVKVAENSTTAALTLDIQQSERSVLSATANVPADTKVESSAVSGNAATLTLTVTDDSAKNVTLSAGDQAKAYDVTISGVAADNDTLIVVRLKNALAAGLTDAKAYHEGTEMTAGSSAALTAAETFWYDAATGDVYVCVTHFSNYTFVYHQVFDITYEGVTNATHNNPTQYTAGIAVSLAPASMDGKTFVGWFLNGEKVTEISAAQTGDLTLTAQWAGENYTIRFVDGDTELQSSEMMYGAMPNYTGKTPTKAATAEYTYTFAGWSPKITAVTGDATYTATYTETKNSYTVTWQDNDGSIIDTTTVEYGAAPEHANPTKANSAFIGWFKENADKPVDLAATQITQNLTLTAHWITYVVTLTPLALKVGNTASLTVKIQKDGVALNTTALYSAEKNNWNLIVEDGTCVDVTKGPTASGTGIQYTFKGLKAGTTTVKYVYQTDETLSFETQITVNHNLTVSFANADLTKANKGVLVESGKVGITSVTLDGVEVNREDYTFASENENVVTIDADAVTPVAAGTTYIVITQKSDQTVTKRQFVKVIPAAAQIGQTYYGTVDAALDAAQDGNIITLAKDVTETVQFSGTAPRANDFNVTIDLNGHTWTGESSKSFALRVDYGTVTVKDSVGGGGVQYGKDYAFVVSHLAGNYPSKLILESGTFTGKTSVAQAGMPGGSGSNLKYYGGTLEVRGGTFVTVLDTGESYDENGRFRYTLNMLDMTAANYPGGIYSESNITVYGGTFHNFDPSDNAAEGAGTSFVPEGYGSELKDGWYTVAKRPEATVTEIPAENRDKNIQIYGLSNPNDPYQTVNELNAEYTFTAQTPDAASKALYGNWNCDYRVTFNSDIVKETFGLYGAYTGYGQDFKIGFLYPTDVTAGDTVNLLNAAGLGSVTYNDVVNNIQEFTCGVFNLSEDNNGKTMKVELVMWAPGADPSTATIIASKTYTFDSPKIATCNHTWGNPTYTWAEDNSTVTATRVCGRDESHIETETVNTTSEVTKAATCEAKGETTYTATFTNSAFAEQTKTVEIPALGHDLVPHDAKAATCTEIGWNAYDTCSRGDYTTYVEIPATGHTPAAAVHENEVAATCTKEGSYDEVVYCSVCDEELSRTVKTIEKIAHTHAEAVQENRKEATCAAEGSYDEVVYCSVCHEELSRTVKTIEKIAHTPTEAVRENEVAATCAAEGSYDEVVYCSVCHEELSRTVKTIEKIAHTHAEAVQENRKEATCTAEGSYDEVVYCSVCHAEMSRETNTIPALGHTWPEPNAAAGIEWTWTEDEQGNMVAVLTLTCRNDETHKETVAGVVSEGVDGTGTDVGYVLYTASATYPQGSSESYTNTYRIPVFNRKLTNNYTYRIGNINEIKLEWLYKTEATGFDGSKVSVECDSADAFIFVANANWKAATIEFSDDFTGTVNLTLKYDGKSVLTQTFEVVDARNVIAATSATTNSVVLLQNVIGGFEIDNGYAVYGNGFEVLVSGNGQSNGSAGLAEGFITICGNGMLDNVSVIASDYPKSYLYTKSNPITGYEGVTDENNKVDDTHYAFQKSAVLVKGKGTITNAYIYGARNNILVTSGELTLKNCTLKNGSLANIHFSSTTGSLNLYNVTTIQSKRVVNYKQPPTANGESKTATVIGAGILMGAAPDSSVSVSTNPVLNIYGSLNQYNWVTKNDSNDVTDKFAKQLIETAADTVEFQHNIAGETKVNLTVIYFNSTTAEINDYRDEADRYTKASVSFGGFAGQVYSPGQASTVIENTDEPQYQPNQGYTLPTIYYTDTEGGRTFVRDSAFDYTFTTDMIPGTSYTFDLSKLVCKLDGIPTQYSIYDNTNTVITDDIVLDNLGIKSYTVVVERKQDNEAVVSYRINLDLVTTLKEVNSPEITIDNSVSGKVLKVASGTDWNILVKVLQGVQVKYYSLKEKDYKTISLSEQNYSLNVNGLSCEIKADDYDYTIKMSATQLNKQGANEHVWKCDTNGVLCFTATAKNLVSSGTATRNTTITYTFTDMLNKSATMNYSTGSIDKPQNNETVYNHTTFMNNSKLDTMKYNTGGGGGSCIPSGTMITLADGTQKPVEELTMADRVLAFNHETGRTEGASIIFLEADGVDSYRVLTLTFADGSTTRLIYEHGYFDLDLMQYVYIREDNCEQFIGHRFYKADGTSAVLTDVAVTEEVTGCFSFPTEYHLNFFTDGFLSMPGGIEGMFNIFAYDTTLRYDETKMQQDIETYGLMDYSDFADVMTYEEYLQYPAQYMAIAMGKGVMTEEQLAYLIDRYVASKR